MVESKHKWKAWLYLAPAIVLLLIFTVWPIINTVRIAFLDGYNMLQDKTTDVVWNFGIDNFLAVFEAGSGFLTALGNTLLLTFITVPLSTVLALLIAVCLNSIKPLQKLLQTIFFLPYVTNSIAIGMVFMAMFNYVGYGNQAPDVSQSPGIINSVLEWLDLDGFINWIAPNFLPNLLETIETFAASELPIEVLASKLLNALYTVINFEAICWINSDATYFTTMFVLIVYIVWNALPFKILILLGGLQSVNKQYYDAAKIDSTSRFRVFTRITVPLLSPMISYVVITGFIGGFKEYSSVVGIFGEEMECFGIDLGTMVGYVNKSLMGEVSQEGKAAAGALILFAIIFAVTMVNLYVSKKNTHY